MRKRTTTARGGRRLLQEEKARPLRPSTLAAGGGAGRCLPSDDSRPRPLFTIVTGAYFGRRRRRRRRRRPDCSFPDRRVAAQKRAFLSCPGDGGHLSPVRLDPPALALIRRAHLAVECLGRSIVGLGARGGGVVTRDSWVTAAASLTLPISPSKSAGHARGHKSRNPNTAILASTSQQRALSLAKGLRGSRRTSEEERLALPLLPLCSALSPLSTTKGLPYARGAARAREPRSGRAPLDSIVDVRARSRRAIPRPFIFKRPLR